MPGTSRFGCDSGQQLDQFGLFAHDVGELELHVGPGVAQSLELQRQVFTLRVTEGMAYGEIAKVVESTEGACRVHYHNAMRIIKERLRDE